MFFKIIGNVEFYKWKEYVYLMEELFLKEIMKYMCKMCMYVIMYSLDLICYVRKYYIVKFYCILCNKFFMMLGSFVYYKRFVYGVQDVEVVMGLEGVELVKQIGGEIYSDLEMNEYKEVDINGNLNGIEYGSY